MDRPIAQLAAKIAVTQRMIDQEESLTGMDSIVWDMVRDELRRDMPRLRAKMIWLRSQAAERRIRYAAERRKAA